MNRLAENALISRCRDDARRCAEMLDDAGSENEFRLKCAVLNLDPNELFRAYIDFIWLMTGIYKLGVVSKPSFSDWWAFEHIPGAVKPDPWYRDHIDMDSW